tara:strand:+ start:5245 stop:5559 length:315 start_codon:yes stop_codon:yes gene_type:complete
MVIAIIIIAALVYFIFIKPFLQQRDAQNFASYFAVPDNFKLLIEEEEVFELAELLVGLELNKDYQLARIVLDAIASKGFSFSRRVDKIRNEMRIKVGLGPLKNF